MLILHASVDENFNCIEGNSIQNIISIDLYSQCLYGISIYLSLSSPFILSHTSDLSFGILFFCLKYILCKFPWISHFNVLLANS